MGVPGCTWPWPIISKFSILPQYFLQLTNSTPGLVLDDRLVMYLSLFTIFCVSFFCCLWVAFPVFLLAYFGGVFLVCKSQQLVKNKLVLLRESRGLLDNCGVW